MKHLQPIRGTHDLAPDAFETFHAITALAREMATLYGFKEMATPILEMTEVFARSMGESSDVVGKEMYSFDSKGGENITLRPEFTAGIVRAFLSGGMQQHLPLKLFSAGPLFRYERPQKGRQRQFHQVNFEWLGQDSPWVDVEIITLAGQFLHQLLGQKGCTLHINTLGDKESRASYREALVAYLTPFQAELSEDSKRRLEQNPLRILDSKDQGDQAILTEAPRIYDHLNDASRHRFDLVLETLEEHTGDFFDSIVHDQTIVRGLDYYTDTVFECLSSSSELGAQNTLLAGGRYDGLVEQMGGKPTPAIGFAAGMERLMLVEKTAGIKKAEPVLILPLAEHSEAMAIALATALRSQAKQCQQDWHTQHRFSVDILYSGNLGKRMKKADNMQASHVIFLGEDEIKSGTYTVQTMQTGEKTSITKNPSHTNICRYFSDLWKERAGR